MDSDPLILLVDDDANDEELSRLALELSRIPHRLVVVRDGAAALDWLLHHGPNSAGDDMTPHLILLDLKLPKVDGLEVLQQLRCRLASVVPVVVFTSSNEERDLSEAYRLGANAYVRKPVDFQEYKALIADVGSFWICRNQTVA